MAKYGAQKIKLITAYCFLAVVPVLVIFIYFYQNIYDRVESELLSASGQSLSRVANAIDRGVEQAFDLSNKIYSNKVLYDALEADYPSPSQYFDAYSQIIFPTLKLLSPIGEGIKYYYIYVDNPTVVGGGYIDKLESLGPEYIESLKAPGPGDSRNSEGYIYKYGNYYNHQRSGMMFSFFRVMEPYKNNRRYEKIIRIDFEPDFFFECIRGADFRGDVEIADKNNRVICSISADGTARYWDGPQPAGGSAQVPDKYRLSSPFGALDGWSVGGVAEVDYIKASLDTQRNIAAVLLVFCVAFATGVAYRLVNAIYMSRLRETQITLQKKQAELSALKSQVDPHFLFNMLETIRMKLVLIDQKEHSTAIMRMAKLYRKLTAWEDDLIPLSEEIEFIREFMFIQEYRYGNSFVWQLDVDAEAVGCRVPKMLFQSFIENACKHGMNTTGEESRINISFSMRRGSLFFSITDNGDGFSKDEADKFYALLNGRDEALKGIGIYNAVQRLKLYYGDGYSLDLETVEGEGATIRIILPASVA